MYYIYPNEQQYYGKVFLSNMTYANKKTSEELFFTSKKVQIRTDGLFMNADSGFDSKNFRSGCLKWGNILNAASNYRNGETKDEYLVDDLLHKQRFIIERAYAWIDSFISPLNMT